MNTPTSLAATVPASAPTARQRMLGGFGWSGLLGIAVLAFWVLAALFGPALLARGLASAGGSEVFGPMSAAHWLGTDYLGRDMLIRVIDGTRYTVGVALVATVLASGSAPRSRCWRRRAAAGSMPA